MVVQRDVSSHGAKPRGVLLFSLLSIVPYTIVTCVHGNDMATSACCSTCVHT